MVRSEKGIVYPKVIDYACGAGHFLTEGIEAINYFAHSDEDSENKNEWVRDHIFGIEKDYRLARVAKISLFMNGAGEGNIIFGDGLENAPDKGVENGKFDILVANPPYSVKDFKQHLQLKNNEFTLLERIGLNGGEIETLFVERIGQLLKPRGIAAVILPSSILSNDSASYTGAREQILRNFYIRGIAAFGSKTFGATGTNTVVMFLEKFNEPPKQSDLSSDSVDAVFNGAKLTEWKDEDIFEAYLAQIEVDEDVYRLFLNKTLSMEELEETDYFKMYVPAFVDSADAKNLLKTRAFRDMTSDDQKTAYLEKFYGYAHTIEREKLFYFSLVYQQTTVIITAPTDNKEQKDFLGYDWSNRKGNEGIQIIKPGGKMYDDADRAAEGTLANAIKISFAGIVPTLSEQQLVYGTIVNTKNMLDYSRSSFSKTIRVYTEERTSIASRYEIKALDSLIYLNRFGINPNDKPDEIFTYVDIDAVEKGTGVISFSKTITGNNAPSRARRVAHKDNIIISTVRPNLRSFAYLSEEPRENTVFSTGFGILEIKDRNTILPYYLYLMIQNSEIIMQQMLAKMGKGQYPSINEADIKSIRLPVPPITIQQQIINECAKIDEEFKSSRMNIDAFRKKIEDLFTELDASGRQGVRLTLSDSGKFTVSIGKRVLDKELVPEGTIPVYSANVTEPFGFIDKLLITDFSVPSVLWGIDGDWMTSYIPENTEFYPTDHCGVLRCKTKEVNPRYLVHILEVEGRKMGFSRSYRASIDRVQGITFSVPDITLQNRIIAKITEFEKKIGEAEQKIKEISAQKEEIVKKLLQ